MKLYYYRGACSLVVRIILNELGVTFEDEAVDLHAKKTAAGGDYLAINPKGAVPALQLDNGIVLTEVQAILQYLSDHHTKHHLLAPVGDLKRYQTLEWMNFVSTELHKTLGMFYNPAVPEEFKTKTLIPMVLTRFSLIDKQLAKSDFLMGETMTLPDAYLYVMLFWARFFKLDLEQFPYLFQFYERMQARPSVIISRQQEQLSGKGA